jgi:octaprenyl-diphosphate synthase
MSSGELFSLEMNNNHNITIDDYLRIIYSKTAKLIESAATVSATLYTNDSSIVQKFSEFGKNIGMGFQIKDDILDYSTQNNIGKPVGNDIKEKQITLPLIHTLANTTQTEKNTICEILNLSDINDQQSKIIIELVYKYEGIQFATEMSKNYIQKAIDNIKEFEQSE